MFGMSFWTNTIWYILLGVITLVMIACFIIKADKRKIIIALYFTVTGIALNFETVIMIYFNAYTYYPLIIKDPLFPMDDSLAGNLFSQFSVAAAMLLVVVLDLKYYWYFIIASLYALIEELFKALGVYKQNWYSTWYTLILLIFGFWLAKKMYKWVVRGLKPIPYYIFIFVSLFTLYVISILWGFMVSGHVAFSTTFFKNPVSSRYFLSLAVLYFPLVAALMPIYFMKNKWLLKSLLLVCLFVYFYVMNKIGLIWIKEGWFIIVTVTCVLWLYLSILLMDKLYGGHRNV